VLLPVVALALVHDVHVSHLRVVVEGPAVTVQARLFHDDLERALRAHTGAPTLALSSPAGDSAFARYFAERVRVTAAGRALAPRLLAARDERDAAGWTVRVYVVALPADGPVGRLALRNSLLFETFRDQQNLVAVLRMPGERRTSLYFAPGDLREQVVPD
jgi:hypothetical protein